MNPGPLGMETNKVEVVTAAAATYQWAEARPAGPQAACYSPQNRAQTAAKNSLPAYIHARIEQNKAANAVKRFDKYVKCVPSPWRAGYVHVM